MNKKFKEYYDSLPENLENLEKYEEMLSKEGNDDYKITRSLLYHVDEIEKFIDLREIKNKCREKFSTLLNDSDRLPDSKYPELKDIKKIIIEFYLDSAIYYAKNKVAFDNLVSKIKPY